jgi:hypothetical protein
MRTYFSFFSITFFLSLVLLFSSYTYSKSAENIFEDFDQDGLSNAEEHIWGTDPYNPDTDGDGYSDYAEIKSGYDPLKSAPGDKIISQETFSEREKEDSLLMIEQENSLNITQKTAAQIAGMVEGASSEGKEITLESIEALVNDAISESNDPIELPEIEEGEIRVLKQDYSQLSEEVRKNKEKEDSVKYLSSLAYVIASTSPQQTRLDSGDIFAEMLEKEISQAIGGFSQGSFNQIESWIARGKESLEMMEEIEVPENMLDIHKKGLQIAKYALSLESISHPNIEDPIGNIAILSRAQGLLVLMGTYQEEVMETIESIGVQEIPLELL